MIKICLEGMGGSGKTTTIDELYRVLKNKGYHTKKILEKEYEPFKTTIQEWYAAGRPEMTISNLEKIIDSRKKVFMKLEALSEDIILFERYMFTTAVYQDTIDEEKVIRLHLQEGIPIIEPTFFLECNPALALNRVYNREKEYPYFKPGLDYFINKYVQFRRLARRFNIPIINTQENTTQQIVQQIMEVSGI